MGNGSAARIGSGVGIGAQSIMTCEHTPENSSRFRYTCLKGSRRIEDNKLGASVGTYFVKVLIGCFKVREISYHISSDGSESVRTRITVPCSRDGYLRGDPVSRGANGMRQNLLEPIKN